MRACTNEQWLADLRGPNPDEALANLYVLLVRGLGARRQESLLERTVPTPGGEERWLVPSMHRTIFNDAYRSHEPDDLRELVSRGCLSPQVLAGLDSTRSYGV